MTTPEHELAAALAAADQQLHHVNGSLDLVMKEAQELLRTHGPTQTWAILTSKYAKTFDCTTRSQLHAVEILVAAALRLAQGSEAL